MKLRPLVALLGATSLALLGFAASATASRSDDSAANIARYSAVPAFVGLDELMGLEPAGDAIA